MLCDRCQEREALNGTGRGKPVLCHRCYHGVGAIRSAVSLAEGDVTEFARRRFVSERKRYGPLTVVLDVDGCAAIVSDYGSMRQKLGRQPTIAECGGTSLRLRDLDPSRSVGGVYGGYRDAAIPVCP